MICECPNCKPFQAAGKNECGCKCHDDGCNCVLLHPELHKSADSGKCTRPDNHKNCQFVQSDSERTVEEKINQFAEGYAGMEVLVRIKRDHSDEAKKEKFEEIKAMAVKSLRELVTLVKRSPT